MLSPSLLVAAYQAGYFPMAMDDGEIRGILPIREASCRSAGFTPRAACSVWSAHAVRDLR